MRAATFLSKEPETLEWIDSIPDNCVLWDVGANIGLYSVYAAKMRGCKVYAFEPSVFNLELLARNIFLNNLVKNITVLPLPISDKLQESTLNMSNTDLGGALSTFGETYGDDGKQIKKVFEFTTIGLSVEEIINKLNIPKPHYMKIDVDGIEHLILKGALGQLGSVEGMLVEVNEDFKAQAEYIHNTLSKNGFILREKKNSKLIQSNWRFKNTFNQIWEKK